MLYVLKKTVNNLDKLEWKYYVFVKELMVSKWSRNWYKVNFLPMSNVRNVFIINKLTVELDETSTAVKKKQILIMIKDQ